MKVLHVILGIGSQGGGPTRSVKGLCRALSNLGVDVTLYAINKGGEFESPCGVKVVYEDAPDIACFDIVHIHGLWNLELHAVVKACRKANVKYVVSPRGTLDPWALSVKKWKKRFAMLAYQRRDLEAASAFHATADEEATHIRAAGFMQPCIVAPNGVGLPVVMPPKQKSPNDRIALFLSRLHPGKGLLSLADAWAKVKPKGWRMKVVGPDSYDHKKDVVAKLVELGIVDQWEFHDALDDVDKWLAYRSADLLVHPSVSENFGITIAEGLAAELPVIATKGTPWSELESRHCGWWIDVGVEPLAKALEEALSLNDAMRREMGVRGKKLIEEKYSWDAVTKAMMRGYAAVIR